MTVPMLERLIVIDRGRQGEERAVNEGLLAP